MNKLKINRESTLALRLTKLIAILTFSLFSIFSLATFIVAYSIEDLMFEQQLLQASLDLDVGKELPVSIEKKVNLSEFDRFFEPSGRLINLDEEAFFGEFSFKDKHYHYMNYNQEFLIMDVTEQGIVSRAFTDILLLLLMILIPCLFLSYFIANKLSQYALKPFHQLTDIFQRKEIKQEQLDEIEESDINAIASQLQQAIEDKKKSLEQQIVFNKGMSHEIRTPLQVIEHSVELVTANNPELSEQASVKRLQKALDRIKRISSALLWLNSDEENTEVTDVESCIKNVISELGDLLSAHNLKVETISQSQLSIKMPSVVLELIFYNLINNAIQHSVLLGEGKILRITIDENEIKFINSQNKSNESNTKGFGLGLQIVSNFARRFDLDFEVKTAEDEYCVLLKIKRKIE